MESPQFEVLVIGAGTGGLAVASRLAKEKTFKKIGVLDPSQVHYYQPLWTLVGGGAATKASTVRKQSDVIPKGVTWIPEAVSTFRPEANSVTTATGKTISYQYLVVAPGMELFWDRVKGLKEALGKNGVCSNYSFETVADTWKFIEGFTGGKALFTFPSTPVKCGGAPQKIMYLAEEHFRKAGVRNKTEVTFVSAAASIFAVKKYAEALLKIIKARDIHLSFRQNLIEIRGEEKVAVFENLDTKAITEMPYDLIHVTPPMGAPKFVRESPLAGADGFVEVNKHTLQHARFANIFALGDAASLPTSRTGAAIRKQAPTLVKNLLAAHRQKPLPASYDGYTSCPLVTGRGKLILAEFDYDGNPKETFPFDQSKERLSMYLLKKYLLPLLYWKGMLKGRA